MNTFHNLVSKLPFVKISNSTYVWKKTFDDIWDRQVKDNKDIHDRKSMRIGKHFIIAAYGEMTALAGPCDNSASWSQFCNWLLNSLPKQSRSKINI